MSVATPRCLNEQIIPVLIRVTLDGSRDDEIVRLARNGLPSSCTDELVFGMPVFKVATLEPSAYETETVRYVISADVKRRKARVLSQLAADMRRTEGVPPVWELDKDEQQRIKLFNKDR